MLISKIRISVFVVLGLAVSMPLTSCATRGYARKQAAMVDNRVSQVAASVQENSERIDAVDGRARQGIADAAAARSAALAAQNMATQANNTAIAAQNAAVGEGVGAELAHQNTNTRIAVIDSRLSALEATKETSTRYSPGPVTLVMFKAGRSDLSKEAQQALDEIVAPIAGQEGDYEVQIEGFASSEGAETKNINLSQERSQSVQRYLVSKGAPAIRIKTVGLGTSKPIGDNSTSSGRQQNRRAEIRVFSATK